MSSESRFHQIWSRIDFRHTKKRQNQCLTSHLKWTQLNLMAHAHHWVAAALCINAHWIHEMRHSELCDGNGLQECAAHSMPRSPEQRKTSPWGSRGAKSQNWKLQKVTKCQNQLKSGKWNQEPVVAESGRGSRARSIKITLWKPVQIQKYLPPPAAPSC